MTKAITIRELLALAEQSILSIDTARLDVEVLLSHSLGMDRASLYASPEREVPEGIVSNFNFQLKKRKDCYPIAYLVGNKEFWSLELNVNQHTLIPRPETECLVEAALELIREKQTVEILDMGTGSGAVALALAKERPESRVLAVDVSGDALVIAKKNARLHQLSNIEFLQSDWFTALKDKQFDMILSNPPYVESNDNGFISGEIRHEPRLALDGGPDGMKAISQLIPNAIGYLKPLGYLILEHGYRQAEGIRQIFLTNRYQNVAVRQDYAGLDRVSIAQWP
jgi:release factor glutamine methyltransferase